MQQLVYAIQFKGAASAVSGNASQLQVKAEAASVSVTSIVNEGGLTGGFDPAAGAPVTFESLVTMTAEGRFTEKGSITFGTGGHRLFFASKGEGWMGPSPKEGTSQGTVTWTIEGGEGQLTGAEGVITSNFTVDSQSTILDHQMGLVYLR